MIVLLLLCARICSSLGSDSPEAGDTGSFWQIADIHYDSNYSSPLISPNLCRVADGFRNSSTGKVGKFGDYECDSSWALAVSAIQAMKAIAPKPDFILWTGDSIPHISDGFIDLDKVYSVVRNVTDRLIETFSDVPIYPMLGNHDVWPAHQLPPTSYSPFYNDMLTKANWSRLLKQEEQNTFKRGGYFSKSLRPGLRLICLNSNLWYTADKLSQNETDPADQFHWLELEMESAANLSEKVILAGHVPLGFVGRAIPSVTWMSNLFNSRLNWFLQRHSSVISVAIFGHEHTDSFHIVYDNGKPVLPVLMAPAVTPWNSTMAGMGANNPAVRLYHYSRATAKIKDYTQYYLNLTKANAEGKANWEVEYRAKGAFNLTDLTAPSLDTLVANFRQENSSLFQRYYKYNSVSLDDSLCVKECKQRHICSMIKIEIADFNKCVSANDDEFVQPVVHATTVPVDSVHIHTTHAHHHNHNIHQFTYYLLGAALVCLVILFFVVAFCCCRRRHAVVLLGRSRYVLIPEV